MPTLIRSLFQDRFRRIASVGVSFVVVGRMQILTFLRAVDQGMGRFVNLVRVLRSAGVPLAFHGLVRELSNDPIMRVRVIMVVPLA